MNTDKIATTIKPTDYLPMVQTGGGEIPLYITFLNACAYLAALTETLTNKTLENTTINGLQAGLTAITTLATADVTLSAAQAKAMIIIIGTAHATNAVIAPATAGKFYLIINNDASTDAAFKAVGSSSPISIVKSTASFVYSDGTDYVKIVLA